MQSFKVFNHGVEVEFKGRLLAQTDTRKAPEQESWSEFQIYATEENKFVVNVLKCHQDGIDNGRSFFCDNLWIVQSVLRHPIYGKINYRAQKCYDMARLRAEKHGLIGVGEYALEIDAEGYPILPESTKKPLPDFCADYDDYDFTETE